VREREDLLDREGDDIRNLLIELFGEEVGPGLAQAIGVVNPWPAVCNLTDHRRDGNELGGAPSAFDADKRSAKDW
jgi:hypothetical protein